MPIRDLHSDKTIPPRFCDVVLQDDRVYLVIKNGRTRKTILWDDVLYQVNAAIQIAASEEQ